MKGRFDFEHKQVAKPTGVVPPRLVELDAGDKDRTFTLTFLFLEGGSGATGYEETVVTARLGQTIRESLSKLTGVVREQGYTPPFSPPNRVVWVRKLPPLPEAGESDQDGSEEEEQRKRLRAGPRFQPVVESIGLRLQVNKMFGEYPDFFRADHVIQMIVGPPSDKIANIGFWLAWKTDRSYPVNILKEGDVRVVTDDDPIASDELDSIPIPELSVIEDSNGVYRLYETAGFIEWINTRNNPREPLAGIPIPGQFVNSMSVAATTPLDPGMPQFLTFNPQSQGKPWDVVPSMAPRGWVPPPQPAPAPAPAPAPISYSPQSPAPAPAPAPNQDQFYARIRDAIGENNVGRFRELLEGNPFFDIDDPRIGPISDNFFSRLVDRNDHDLALMVAGSSNFHPDNARHNLFVNLQVSGDWPDVTEVLVRRQVTNMGGGLINAAWAHRGNSLIKIVEGVTPDIVENSTMFGKNIFHFLADHNLYLGPVIRALPGPVLDRMMSMLDEDNNPPFIYALRHGPQLIERYLNRTPIGTIIRKLGNFGAWANVPEEKQRQGFKLVLKIVFSKGDANGDQFTALIYRRPQRADLLDAFHGLEMNPQASAHIHLMQYLYINIMMEHGLLANDTQFRVLVKLAKFGPGGFNLQENIQRYPEIAAWDALIERLLHEDSLNVPFFNVVVQEMLRRGKNISETHDGHSTLDIAVDIRPDRDVPKLVEILLNAGADPFHRSINSLGPFDDALMGKGLPIIKAFTSNIDVTTVSNEMKEALLQTATRRGNAEILNTVRKWLGMDVALTEGQYKAMVQAFKRHKIGPDIRRNMKLQSFNPNKFVQEKKGEPARPLLVHAIFNLDPQGVKLLLERGAEPNLYIYDTIATDWLASVNRPEAAIILEMMRKAIRERREEQRQQPQQPEQEIEVESSEPSEDVEMEEESEGSYDDSEESEARSSMFESESESESAEPTGAKRFREGETFGIEDLSMREDAVIMAAARRKYERAFKDWESLRYGYHSKTEREEVGRKLEQAARELEILGKRPDVTE